MKKNRLISLFLASILMTAAMTACGGDDTGTADPTPDIAGSAAETEPVDDDIFAQRLRENDNLPERISADAPSVFSTTDMPAPLRNRTATLSMTQFIRAT